MVAPSECSLSCREELIFEPRFPLNVLWTSTAPRGGRRNTTFSFPKTGYHMASLAEWFGGIRKQLDDLNHSGLLTTDAHKYPGVKEHVQQIRQKIREIKDILEKDQTGGTHF